VTNRDRRIARTAALIAFAAATCAASGAAASEGGLVIYPNVDGHFSLLRLFTLVLLFGALVFPVNALIFKPIFRALDARDDKIAGTRRHADRLAAQADEVLARYEQSVREVRQEAENDRKSVLERARADGASTTASARGEAEREVARARSEVASALADARASLRAQAQELAREVAARALGRPL